MITKVINVNLHQPIYEKLTAKQGDIASRYLLFHLLDGDKPFDLSNKTVRVYAIKPDKTEIFNDLTINDARKGYCTLELTSQCLASAGVVKMELYISESGKVLTSIPFELEVIACINTANGVTSTNEFSALEVALGSLQDYDNLRREIIQARKGHEVVGERLDNFDSQLEQKVSKEDLSTEVRSKRVQGENTKSDTKGTFDSANFAGQDLGKNAPIGNVMHHYTDGILFQMDNVGEGNNILILKNAYNPSRRPDKAADFVGTGTFLECLRAVIGSTSLSMFRVDKDGNLLWTDKTDTTQFITNKSDDNKPAFQFKCYKDHVNLLDIVNAGMWELTVKHESNQCVLQSGNKPTNGLKIDAQLGVLDLTSEGDINLNPTSKRVNLHAVTYIYEGVTYNRIVTTRSGASAGRPTSGQYVGMQYLDTSLGTNGKVIWWNGINWIDAMGNIV